jgi:hypothetical protein
MQGSCKAKRHREHKKLGQRDRLHVPADLMSVGASTTDAALLQLQGPVEDLAKWLLTRFRSLEGLVSKSNDNGASLLY